MSTKDEGGEKPRNELKYPAEMGFDVSDLGKNGYEHLKRRLDLEELHSVEVSSWRYGLTYTQYEVEGLDGRVKFVFGHNPIGDEDGSVGRVSIVGVDRESVETAGEAFVKVSTFIKGVCFSSIGYIGRPAEEKRSHLISSDGEAYEVDFTPDELDALVALGQDIADRGDTNFNGIEPADETTVYLKFDEIDPLDRTEFVLLCEKVLPN